MAKSENESAERFLIEAAQRDPSRFGELYEQNFHRVYAFIARRVGDRAEAEDLTAEVFHLALANLARFEWRGVPFAVWLFRIASNAIIDRAKRASREREASRPIDVESSGINSIEDEIERRAELFKLVDELPPNQRQVISLRFAEGKSIREIAHEMNRSEGAIKQLQFRALQSLRAELAYKPGERNG